MVITILVVGKTTEDFIRQGFTLYFERLKHYLGVKYIEIPELKEKRNMSPLQIKEKEALTILSNIPKSATIILLDEHGVSKSSIEFASLIQKQMNTGIKELIFIIGGAFGVSELIKKQSDICISLSKMTFTHQFIRVILAEQLYRAMTILKNEPYHNE
ncbi:MAG: 23S rRNA (pseudouridine(1915)-N(3))-methyltransferase RlmH [Bacteroidales bacterium]|nr:23S rRNA (pseudouridine(1915)-N(3))-methyltransferase RlmH [Bacteroidales bacterium]